MGLVPFTFQGRPHSEVTVELVLLSFERVVILSRPNGFIYLFDGACSRGLLEIYREKRSNG